VKFVKFVVKFVKFMCWFVVGWLVVCLFVLFCLFACLLVCMYVCLLVCWLRSANRREESSLFLIEALFFHDVVESSLLTSDECQLAVVHLSFLLDIKFRDSL